jgi:hypothetical protein
VLLPKIATPSLLIHGEKDALNPLAAAALAKRCRTPAWRCSPAPDTRPSLPTRSLHPCWTISAMPTPPARQRVRESFDRAAASYDDAAVLQRQVCDNLLANSPPIRNRPASSTPAAVPATAPDCASPLADGRAHRGRLRSGHARAGTPGCRPSAWLPTSRRCPARTRASPPGGQT